MNPPRPAATGRLPVLFVGHGNPMNAIVDNQWSRGFRTLAGLLPQPRAILAVSDDVESDLVFVGLVGMQDPPRVRRPRTTPRHPARRAPLHQLPHDRRAAVGNA